MDLQKQFFHINREQRESRNKHKSFVIWLTGLSGAGKSTIANNAESWLFKNNLNVYVLDGDNIRMGINKDLGFTKENRKENIRRVAEIAKLFCDAGLIIITAFISPYAEDRDMARVIIGSDKFIEVFVDASIECCKKRDVKGLYEKAASGLIKSFTGVGDIYQAPQHPEIRLQTDKETINESAEKLISWLKDNNYIGV